MDVIPLTRWHAGCHTGFGGTLYDCFMDSVSQAMYATQFFMGARQAYKRSRVSFKDITKAKKLLEKFPMAVFSHFPYIANLAGSKKSLAWSGNEEQDRKTKFLLKELEYELSILSNFCKDGCGVVIHPGNYPDREKGLWTIAESINKINFTKGSRLLLETHCGAGTGLATTFKEIKIIIDRVEESKRKHIGVCVDTAHVFVYGDYDLRNCDEIDRLFSEFDEAIGLDKFWLLHLNDSEKERGSKVDRHALLGTGHIWKDSFESLIYLLDRCQSLRIPMVLETAECDMLTLAHLEESLKDEKIRKNEPA